MNKLSGIYGCEIESAIADAHGQPIKKDLLHPSRFYGFGVNGFYANGFRIYVDIDHLEFATPECRGIDEIGLYIRAAESQLIHAAQIGASQSDRDETWTCGDEWRIQRRVIDDEGNTWAVHDNFSLEQDHQQELRALSGRTPDIRMRRALAWILAARSIVSGAGIVRDTDFYMSQKLPTVAHWNEYGTISSMFRLISENDAAQRLEIRCSDDLICDRSTLLRYAYVDFALASGLLDSLEVDTISSDEAFLDDIAKSQVIDFDKGGRIVSNEYLERHRKIIVAIAQFSHRYCDGLGVSQEYVWAASELQKTADQLDDILSTRGDVSTLAASGIDWAIKATAIHRDLRKRGVPANQPDEKSKKLDLAYDAIRVHADGTVQHGWGYKFRNTGARPISAEQIRHARFHPPATTRAYDRAILIKRQNI